MTYRLTCVINSLSVGGAQMMMHKLLSRIDRSIFSPEVVSLTSRGDLGDKIADLDIPLRVLGMRRGIPDPRYLLQLAGHFRHSRPDLVQTWMYHADLLGGLAARLASRPPVIWNIRHSNLDPAIDRPTTIYAAKICAMTSGSLPVRIVCCAQKARQMHEDLGYRADKMRVIPNGFDLEKFKPSAESRIAVCRELGIPEHALVIGFVSRFHPMKDHQGFIRAAALLGQRGHEVHYILCGDGVAWSNEELANAIKAFGMKGIFHLLGRRVDVPRLTAAFDIAVSPSACGEAFSNTIGEAMACAVPCAVTDVGDSAAIVGDTGKVVPPKDPEAIAYAWQELIAMGAERRLELGLRARQRVLECFALDSVVRQYEELYLSILQPSVNGN